MTAPTELVAKRKHLAMRLPSPHPHMLGKGIAGSHHRGALGDAKIDLPQPDRWELSI